MKKRDIIKLVKETIAKRRKKFYGQHDYYGNNVGGRSSISGMPGVWEENNNTIRVFRDKDLTILYSKDVPISDILKKGKDILVKRPHEEDNYLINRVELKDGTKGWVGSENQKLSENTLNESQGTLSSDMLNYADQYHMELVDTMKGVSTHPDKRTGGFYIKFPHAEGPPNPALFGKETRMKIEASKAAAKAAAQKTVSKFQDSIEDYEISDSKSGVYGNVWLWIMPKDTTNQNIDMDKVFMRGQDQDAYRQDLQEKKYLGINDAPVEEYAEKILNIASSEKSPELLKKLIKYELANFSTDAGQFLGMDEMFGKKEPFTKDFGSKISPEDFKSKMPVGKTVLYGGTRYKVLENTGYVLTLQSIESGKTLKVNLNQFISQGAIKEKTMKNNKLKEDISDDISAAEDEVQAATQAKADAESKLADARKKKADGEKSALEEDSADSLLSEYMKERGNDNLKEHMDKYRKRNVLMEGAMKRLFTMFDDGMTDEEIVQDHATKGVQVPEAFISKLRKQWEGLKKAKLEMDMAEKEYKNSSQPMVNNPDGSETGMEPIDDKQLASGLTSNESY